ncbi:MAG TPA: molybdate ABC transporter substrate-binding protein [Candidatus Sulfotelmatobacter sp.]|nr:molybdate ABC transporter substrate-binding protein [Candidatus Sulfotelmatobacter sp.]
MRLFRTVAFLICVLMLASSTRAQTLRVAAAADLQFAMSDLASQYEKKTGTKPEISYGSSGNFRAQIANGAPFDVFFSADAMYPEQLVTAGVADASSLVVYGQGHLVLWAPGGANLQLAQRGFAALKDARVMKIAIANPEHAPYGRAAVAALQKAGLYEEVKPKLVLGENISQAAQFAQSGNAQVGILALSLTFAESMKSGERWEIPAEYYPAILQKAVIVSASKNKSAAKAFLDFVKSDEGRRILAKYGLAPPESSNQP